MMVEIKRLVVSLIVFPCIKFTSKIETISIFKSELPKLTIASKPYLTQETCLLCLLASKISKPASNAALYSVEDTWHTPPPTPSTNSLFTIIFASIIYVECNVSDYYSINSGNELDLDSPFPIRTSICSSEDFLVNYGMNAGDTFKMDVKWVYDK